MMPVVAIVGRPNVGKSSLLNALSGKRISIVQDMPGVTRDRVSMPLEIDGHFIELVDTGGYGFDDPDLAVEIKHQIEMAMVRANLVLLVVDCVDGPTTADKEIAGLLRQKEIKTVLVANKADGPNADVALADFARLGLGTPIGVSALRARNLELVIDAIGANLDLSSAPTTLPDPQMMVAIVGKRNAGKSTLVNSIAAIYEGEGDRVIVSEVPGTTRDSIDVRFEKEGKTLVVIDTAGVRKKRHMVTNDIEFYSFHRAERSIRRADVVLLLVDGTEPISDPDRKLGAYILGEFKPVVIVVNKWDLARKIIRENRAAEASTEVAVRDEDLMVEYRKYLDNEMPNLKFAPIAFVTATEGRNVEGLMNLCQHLFNQTNLRLNTARLNQAVRQILDQRLPSTQGGHKPRVYYATQTDVAPPTIVLFTNNTEYFTEAYLRFMINRFRELLPYAQVPIKLLVRGRDQNAAMRAIQAEDASSPAASPRRQGPGKRPSEPKPHPKRAHFPTSPRGRRQHPH